MKIALSDNAVAVLCARYLKKNADGVPVETPETMFRRVAHTIAAVDTQYGCSPQQVQQFEESCFDLMTSLRFLPNSPTLMNAGRRLGMLSACFVLPVDDSIEGIFEAVKDMALIQRAGGGTGFAFDSLRPTGDLIASSGGPTSGPVSFWRVFNEATEAVQQGAFRRGANMAMCDVRHPDVLKFITAKQDPAAFTNFNVSVKVPDEWMRTLEQTPRSPHSVVNPHNGQAYWIPKPVEISSYRVQDLLPPGAAAEQAVWTVGDLWQLIVEQAWRTGEPGMAFIDRINQANPTPQAGQIEATNPCGEQPLLPYEACNLGSLNLAKYTRDRRVCWTELERDIRLAVRFLDNIIDVNRYPLEKTRQICTANRKIGLGVMGWADMLIRLGVSYDSTEALQAAEKVMGFVNETGHAASAELAEEKGAFPGWKNSIWSGSRHRLQRNATVTTVAPTGTLSIIADCSGGIEPLFNLVFYRRILNGQVLRQVSADFRDTAEEMGFASRELYDFLADGGRLHERDDVPGNVKKLYLCAHDIPAHQHVAMQAAFQRHCDAAVSKTINFPHDAPVEDVADAFRLAYRSGCKGITVYRDRCRADQPMSRILSPRQAAQRLERSEKDKGDGKLERLCPQCGAELAKATGCIVCENCGFSSCDLTHLPSQE